MWLACKSELTEKGLLLRIVNQNNIKITSESLQTMFWISSSEQVVHTTNIVGFIPAFLSTMSSVTLCKATKRGITFP